MVEVLVQGREAMPDERIRASLLLQKFANANGWETRIGYSKFQDDSKIYKSGDKKGKEVPGKILDNVWCQGRKEGHVFTAVWIGGKLDNCLFDRRLMPMKELRERISRNDALQELQRLAQETGEYENLDNPLIDVDN